MLSYPEVMQIVNGWSIRFRKTQRINLALLVQGILASRSGCLSTIVRSWKVGSSRHIHRLKRLHRFLKNSAVTAEPVFRAAAAVVWSHRPGGQRTRLVPVAIDWTKVRQFATIWAAVPRKGRALPVAFGVYHHHRLRHSQNKLERGLCTLVADLLPRQLQPLFLADAGFGRAEFIRWLKKMGFAFVVRLRPDTSVWYRGRRVRLGDFDTLEGAPIMLSAVQYRGEKPVTVNIVISRQGDKIWYLGTSFNDAKQAVAWYQKRFWIEEMFRDLKSRLGLRKARLKDEHRLTRLLLGYLVAYLVLCLVGLKAPPRWHGYLPSRGRASFVWLAQAVIDFLHHRPRHRKVWKRHIWPTLVLKSG